MPIISEKAKRTLSATARMVSLVSGPVSSRTSNEPRSGRPYLEPSAVMSSVR